MDFMGDVFNSVKLDYYQSKMKLYSRKIKKATKYAEEVDSWRKLRDYYKRKFDKIIERNRD